MIGFKNTMDNENDPCLIRCLKAHKESVISLDLHPTCKYVASAAMDNIIFFWDLVKRGPPKKMMGHKSQVNDVKFSPTGNLLASASSDQSIKFWDVDFDTEPKQITLIKAHNARIRSIAFSCDGLLLASAGDDKTVKVWSTVDRRAQFTLKNHQNWIRYCQFSATATNIVSCDDKLIHIWDLATKKCIQTYQKHSGVIHQAKFHSMGNCLASCSHDKKVKVYDLRSQHVIQTYQGHQGPVKSIDFHPTSPYLVSSSDDGSTKIWNSQKGQLQYTLESHSNRTIFSRQGDYFVTGGSDKIVNIWKTGFYDSFKEKIDCNEGPSRKVAKVIQNPSNVNRVASKMTDPTQRFELPEQTENRQAQEVLYDHQQDNFELVKACGQTKTSQQPKSNSIIPGKLARKIQCINSQIQFITKTTQILESRVVNNGQHLKRIISLMDVE